MRTHVVTGAASGIGLATVNLIEASGGKAIGVDIKDCQVIADLSTHEGRQHAIEKATNLADGLVDAVLPNSIVRSPFTFLKVMVRYYSTCNEL